MSDKDQEMKLDNIGKFLDEITDMIGAKRRVSLVGVVKNVRCNNGWVNFRLSNDEKRESAVEVRAREDDIDIPQEGQRVAITGELDLYRVRGCIQIMISSMTASG